jgi:hypothetical protein
LKAGIGGGLQVTVPKTSDSITFMQDSGAPLNSVEMRANSVVYKDSAGNPVVQVTTSGATLAVGAQGAGGRVAVQNANAQTTVSLDGNSGAVNTSRINAVSSNAIDVHAGAFRVHSADFVLDGRSGGNKRALVDGNNRLILNFNNDFSQGVQVQGTLMDGGGTPLMGNPARKVTYTSLFCQADVTDVQDIDLGFARPFLAFVSYSVIDSLGPFDRGNAVAAEVYRVDGQPTWKYLYGGDHFGANGADSNVHEPMYRGFGRVIQFRARAFSDCNFFAFAVVFYE